MKNTEKFSFRALLEDPYEEIAYNKGLTLRGINLKHKGETYLMVLKVTGRIDGNLVAFIEAETCLACWEFLHRWLHYTDVGLKLHKDKWA